jgi:hypothetical protein
MNLLLNVVMRFVYYGLCIFHISYRIIYLAIYCVGIHFHCHPRGLDLDECFGLFGYPAS